MTMFKVFASCIVIVCTSSVSSRVIPPVLESISTKIDESPIIEKHLDKQHEQNENLVGLDVVDLKHYDFGLIANAEMQKLAIMVYEPMASSEYHRQRRSFDPKLEERLRKDIKGENNALSIPLGLDDAVAVNSPKFNDVKNSQESNENQENGNAYDLPNPPDTYEEDNPQESNESGGSQESNQSGSPQESNQSGSPQESNESGGSQESNQSGSPQESNESGGSQEPDKPSNPQEPNESSGPQEPNKSSDPQEPNKPSDLQEPNQSKDPQETKDSDYISDADKNDTLGPPDSQYSGE